VARTLLWNRLNTSDNDRPQQASAPFGVGRRGMVVSEGGGLVILESLAHAQSRGARIYAEVVGFGAGTDVRDWAEPDPSGGGMALALRNALRDATGHRGAAATKDSAGGGDTLQVDLVNPFGTGTVDYDLAEMTAWNDVLGPQLDRSPALCTRGATGNNGAGSGAIDFAATVLALYRNTVPSSYNTDSLDGGCRFSFVQADPIDARIDRAVSLGHALSGRQAAALVIERFRE
ncbi:MAG: hypothetical protein ACE5EX_11575, partial [Phycisphaerae bacterium]